MYLQPFLVYKQVLANKVVFGEPASKVRSTVQMQIAGGSHVALSTAASLNSTLNPCGGSLCFFAVVLLGDCQFGHQLNLAAVLPWWCISLTSAFQYRSAAILSPAPADCVPPVTDCSRGLCLLGYTAVL